jgi:hypothetical protein
VRRFFFVVFPRVAFHFALAVAAVFWLCELSARGDEKGDVRGCYVTYHSTTGTFSFEPFLKVADKESASEDGEPEVWGFRPWNLEPPDEDGKTHPVNVLADRFVPLGIFKEVRAGTITRRIRCPEGLWRDDAR